MLITQIETPEDILEFMKENIQYGWLDLNGEEHINNMKNFRKLYRTSSIEETLQHGIGTCIEQVALMSSLLDLIHLPNKMYCTRIYEGTDFQDLEAEEHMHCFVLFGKEGKVYQIEHPNTERIGIYSYSTEEEAIQKINDYYVELSGGIPRPITEFYEVEPNLSFQEFNDYINQLDEKKNQK